MKKFYSEARVIYGDTDAMGIVYHNNYIRWFEQGRTEFLRQIGFPYSELEKVPFWLPVTYVHCDYKSPGFYDDVLEIAAWPAKMTYATVDIAYEIRRKETGELLVTGATGHAMTDDKLKPVRLKKLIPELYAAMTALLEETADEF
ncbi:MAG: acyl-CoA thioesterase [Clostridiales Family XIII bacterium]|jgi:acyl-CoA thioester hydrolase|nr:acyl-CoA thioesterase [Clostridiales Family XIII bacterium]